MEVHKVTLIIVDVDEIGASNVKRYLESTKYPNWCMHPDVKQIETRECGEWGDEHPLNHHATADAELARLFS